MTAVAKRMLLRNTYAISTSMPNFWSHSVIGCAAHPHHQEAQKQTFFIGRYLFKVLGRSPVLVELQCTECAHLAPQTHRALQKQRDTATAARR